FYYVYPHLLKNVKLPKQFKRYEAAIKNISDPFEITPSQKILFFELYKFQDSAIETLAQRSIINIYSSMVTLNLSPVPSTLKQAFEADYFSKSEFFRCLIESFPKLKLEGRGGFKDRSGLMEFRYD